LPVISIRAKEAFELTRKFYRKAQVTVSISWKSPFTASSWCRKMWKICFNQPAGSKNIEHHRRTSKHKNFYQKYFILRQVSFRFHKSLCGTKICMAKLIKGKFHTTSIRKTAFSLQFSLCNFMFASKMQ